LSPDLFWDLTPRELYREFAAENARRRDQANRDARLAWLAVAIWATTTTKKRVPPLKDYLIAAQAAVVTRADRAAQHRSALQLLSEQYGIPLRYRKKKTKKTKQ